MVKKRCLLIPAIKKNAVIPDQLVKKLAGKTLIARALETALGVAPPQDVMVVTDSDEIRLICERAGVGCFYDAAYRILGLDIVSSLRPILERLASEYERIIIYRASAPLVAASDIEDAYSRFTSSDSDCLVTVKSIQYRLWRESGNSLDALLFNEEEQKVYAETKSLVMLKSSSLRDAARSKGAGTKAIPYFMHDRGIEIASYLDWWVCEKILRSRHIVFVVAGYPAIGMGHIYRALMFAHEIADHRITFLCTKESGLAAANIAARDYRTVVQREEDLAAEVLRLKPDLVINDMLDTSSAYVAALKQADLPVVNFEDEGDGAALADIVINALYSGNCDTQGRRLYGPGCFCLRDEFLHARRNDFRARARRLLITFGGTDDSDYTRQCLAVLWPLCRAADIALRIVAGPGYAHKEPLSAYIEELKQESGAASSALSFTSATNVMSREMEDTDMAVCSAGRTVYELAHMRIPAIVLAHNEREKEHRFARAANGFIYLGLMRGFNAAKIRTAFHRLADSKYRELLFFRQDRFDFSPNKARVVKTMLNLLEKEQA